MPVVSVSMPESLLEELDTFIDEYGYSGRSEAMREGARGLLTEFDEPELGGEPIVATITTVFGHETDAETRLSELRHSHQELVTSNVHSHAGDACLELFVAEGTVEEVGAFVSKLRSVSGVSTVEYAILPPDQRALA
ncbi:CopG family ribbon-helix-helix protein [Halobacteria archaeon AArc-dxtr1]|nr:CopG family ribbon-helix-helix protein [Halobacteria archaeon AArc-dxtr1]